MKNMITSLVLCFTILNNFLGVNGINFSFPETSMYNCNSHCQTLNMQCVELSTYSCEDAAKIVTHRNNLYDLNSIKTDCSTGAGCFVDRFSLMYSELIRSGNNTCNQVPVCTDIHGGSLQKMRLLCGCKPLEVHDAPLMGLSVELTTFQLGGIATLLLCAMGLLLFLLKKCCSATLFLRYRALEDEEEVMEHFLQKDLTLSTRMAWCLCYEPCIAMCSACPVIVQECPGVFERMVDRILDVLDCFSLLTGKQEEDSEDEEKDDGDEEEGYAGGERFHSDDSDDSEDSEDSEAKIFHPSEVSDYTNANTVSRGGRGAYTTAKKSDYFTSSTSSTSTKKNMTIRNNNNKYSNNKNNKIRGVEMTRHHGPSSNNVMAKGGGRAPAQQSHRQQRPARGDYSDSSSSSDHDSYSSSGSSGSSSGSGSNSDYSE